MGEAIINYKNGVFEQAMFADNFNAGTIITFYFILMNTGDAIATNIIFTDIIPYGTSYIQNTLKVNDFLIAGANPVTGVNLGKLEPDCEFITIKFKVMITVTQNSIHNIGQVNYMDPNYKGGLSNFI